MKQSGNGTAAALWLALSLALFLTVAIIAPAARAQSGAAPADGAAPSAARSVPALAADLRVGDIVFIRVPVKPFLEVAAATGSWTNHVGIVVDTKGSEPLVGESTFPFSRTTALSRFAARSQGGRVAVMRLATPLTGEQQVLLAAAARRRSGIFYDTGFDLRSKREFCSRYVREVVAEATGTELGEVETFGDVLRRHPDADQGFWKLWFFGRIPWERETVTPASILASRELTVVFDGTVAPGQEAP